MTFTLPQHLAVIALVALDVLVRGLRYRSLVPMPLARAVGVTLCGDAAGAMTPVGIGADPIRFAASWRSGAAASAVLAAFVTEFGMSVVALVAGAAILSGIFAGAAGQLAHRLEALAAPSWTLRVLAFGVLPTVISVAVAVRFRHRLPPALVHHLRDVRFAMRSLRPALLVTTGCLTLVSLAARTAILPVLAVGLPGMTAGMLIVGSYMLLVGQAVLPTPAGAGGVELGFLVGFSGSFTGGDAGRLLLVWRFYTLLLAVGAGALLLARAGWLRRTAMAAPASQDSAHMEVNSSRET